MQQSQHSVSISMHSDILWRTLTFLIITPAFLVFFYQEVLVTIAKNEGFIKTIEFLALNSISIVSMIACAIFMRGNNNRSALYFDSAWPFIFWPFYSMVGRWAFPADYNVWMPFLWLLGQSFVLCWMLNRVNIETKMLFLSGKYGTLLLDKLGLTKQADALEERVLSGAESKGSTNFQFFLILFYSVAFALPLITVVYFGVASFFVEGNWFTPGFLDMAVDATGYNIWYLTDEIESIMIITQGIGMFYYAYTDYKTPDKIHHSRQIKNYTGRGGKTLV